MTKVLALSLVLASQGISPRVPQGRVIAGWSAIGAGLLLGAISGTAFVFELGADYAGPRHAGLYLSAVGLGVGLGAIITGIVLLLTNAPAPPLRPAAWLTPQGGGVGVRLAF